MLHCCHAGMLWGLGGDGSGQGGRDRDDTEKYSLCLLNRVGTGRGWGGRGDVRHTVWTDLSVHGGGDFWQVLKVPIRVTLTEARILLVSLTNQKELQGAVHVGVLLTMRRIYFSMFYH